MGLRIADFALISIFIFISILNTIFTKRSEFAIRITK